MRKTARKAIKTDIHNYEINAMYETIKLCWINFIYSREQKYSDIV